MHVVGYDNLLPVLNRFKRAKSFKHTLQEMWREMTSLCIRSKQLMRNYSRLDNGIVRYHEPFYWRMVELMRCSVTVTQIRDVIVCADENVKTVL